LRHRSLQTSKTIGYSLRKYTKNSIVGFSFSKIRVNFGKITFKIMGLKEKITALLAKKMRNLCLTQVVK